MIRAIEAGAAVLRPGVRGYEVDAAARRVIEFLRDAGYAILGVEIWTAEGTAPRVWGWSEYSVSYSGDWRKFVSENALRALEELEKPLPANAVVNLTWADERDFCRRDSN